MEPTTTSATTSAWKVAAQDQIPTAELSELAEDIPAIGRIVRRLERLERLWRVGLVVIALAIGAAVAVPLALLSHPWSKVTCYEWAADARSDRAIAVRLQICAGRFGAYRTLP